MSSPAGSSKATFPPRSAPMCASASAWERVMTKIRSASSTIARVTGRARWALRSAPASAAAAMACGVAGASSRAYRPALSTVTPLSGPSRARAIASAIAERQVFPVHTNRTLMARPR